MSPRLPRIGSRKLTSTVRKLGFKLDRQSGSHAIYYRESDKRRVVIPIHSRKDLKPKTLLGIIKDMGLSVDEFRELL